MGRDTRLSGSARKRRAIGASVYNSLQATKVATASVAGAAGRAGSIERGRAVRYRGKNAGGRRGKREDGNGED